MLARRGLLLAVLVSLILVLPLVVVRAASAGQDPPFRPPRGPQPRPEITFNHPPRTPDPASMSTSDPTSTCVTSQADEPTVDVTPARGITLKLTPTDPDGDNVQVFIQFWQAGASTPLVSYASALVSSGTPAVAQLLGNTALLDGVDYAWRARVRDFTFGGTAKGISRWSAWCWLKQDGTRPSSPLVTSDQPGRFTFSPGTPADTDITGYLYGIDQPSPGTAVGTGAGGATGLSATVSVAPPSGGPHDLFVQAVDRAGNRSDPTDYHFFVNAPAAAPA